MPFAKLDSEITKSSLWSEGLHVRVVFMSFVSVKDESGFVAGARSGLIRVCNVTADQFDDAIKVLSSPDTESKSQEYEGRRIAKCDGGYVVLNAEKYRLPEHEKKENHRLYMQEWRKNNSDSQDVTDIHVNSREFTKDHERSPSVSVSESVSLSSSESLSESIKEDNINRDSLNSNLSDTKKKSTKKKKEIRPDCLEVSKYFRTSIERVAPGCRLTESQVNTWADTFRLMVEIDKRTIESIKQKIDDIFLGGNWWNKTIRSADTLRLRWNEGKLDSIPVYNPSKTQEVGQRPRMSEKTYLEMQKDEAIAYDRGKCKRTALNIVQKKYPLTFREIYLPEDNDEEKYIALWSLILMTPQADKILDWLESIGFDNSGVRNGY